MPSAVTHSLRRSTDKAVVKRLRRHVTFKLESSGSWRDWDLASNKISLPWGGEPTPGYITRLRDKLSQKRLVTEADTEAEEVGTSGFFPFFLFLWGKEGNASCTVALLGAVWACHWSLDNSAARSIH